VDQISVVYRIQDDRPEILIDDRREILITDREQISDIVRFIKERNRDWRKPRYTFPSGEYTVSLKRNGETALVLWVSPGWIGGREGGQGASDNRLRNISSDEWDQLVELLQINANADP
jgi:hypothetical protein